MRLSYLLLVAAAALLATGNAASIEADAGTRSLRSHTTRHNKAQDEERAFRYTFSFRKWDDFFSSLPNQFERMRKEPSYLRQTFKNWRSGMGTSKEAVAYMRSQGLSEKAIDQFEDAFKSYLTHKLAKGK
ncbi:hypothetical protein V7S43_018309 [Phytophthora oleae]|uniref:RxLR effector protein n=1 Tax=Phytophthora oleae TaxID=2107226 RepID=A0ABD3ERJ9_9STRA